MKRLTLALLLTPLFSTAVLAAAPFHAARRARQGADQGRLQSERRKKKQDA